MTPRATTRLRSLLARPGLVVAPSIAEPLTARVAVEAGFECLALGGYALGASLAVTEPLTTMTEVVDAARRILAVVDVPLVVDAGTGFGDPLHAMRTVRELEQAGAAALHIEDQVFPKRAHYHREYREHTIPADEMAEKIRFACQARQDPDLVLIARTDAMKTHGYAEGMRRARLYAEAGADMVMLFPNTDDEARRAPRESPVPLVYVNSVGNRVGRPVYGTQALEALGYRLDVDAISASVVAYQALRDLFGRLRATGLTGLDHEATLAARRALERTIGLEEHYRIEEQTVERERR